MIRGNAMTDMFDKATETEEQFRNQAIDNIRKNAGQSRHLGRCLCCNAQVENNGLFCNIDCREDYELTQRIRRITGRPT